jgi:hypothetical protein
MIVSVERDDGTQKLSALTTSPPALVPRVHQVRWLIDSLMNRTLPSAMSVLTPPGWRLSALLYVPSDVVLVELQCVH